MQYGPSLSLTRPHRFFGGGPADPVSEPVFLVGRDTIAGAGAQATTDAVLGGFTTVPDSATIIGGTNADHWQIVDGYKLSPSSNGRAAGLLGGPLSDGDYDDLSLIYTVDGSDFVHNVIVMTVENEYSVATRAEADAAIADKGTADKGLLGCSGHKIKFASAHGQSNGQGPAVHDGGTTHPSGTFHWRSSSWPNSNVIEEISDTLIQQHNNTQISGNMGPDIGFAERFHELNPNCTLILVGACQHATAIQLHEKYSTIYQDAVTRINALTTRHPNFECYGAYWAQGESDGQAGIKTTVEYADICTTMIADLREAIDAWGATTPFAIMGFTPTSTYSETEAAFPLIAARVNYCGLIDNVGLAGDSIHFLAAGLRGGGVRLADVIQTATAKEGAPTIQELTPADGAATVNAGQVLAADFGVPIQAGTGSITVKNLTDATDEGIALPDTKVTFDGTVLTIKPSRLVTGKSFAVRIDATAVDDAFGNSFAGITDDMTWNFTTSSADALDPSFWCENLDDWWDAGDLATITETGGLVDQWNSKGNQGNILTATNTNRPAMGTGVLSFNGTSNRIGIATMEKATGVPASIWMAMRSGDEVNNVQIFLSRLTTASGPYIYTRADSLANKGLSAGASTINIHPAMGSLDTLAFQTAGEFYDHLGAGTPGDYVVEIQVADLSTWTGFFVGGMASYCAKFDLYQLAIMRGVGTFERRANMLAFMQSKIA